MADLDEDGRMPDVRNARTLFPATRKLAYLNTAAVGLASEELADAYRGYIDDWVSTGPDFPRGDAAGETARTAVADLIGVKREDVALIATVSAAAGLVAAQFPRAERGQNIVIGEREFASNSFAWKLLARKGYQIRAVPFRNGGMEPEVVADAIDRRTELVAFSAVQSSSGHRSDIPALAALAKDVGAIVFVDGTQQVGAMQVGDLTGVDVFAFSDHKFLLNAGRGVGYCYLSRAAQIRFTPTNAGWKAARVPYQSFFGPTMDLSPTASRFDSPISWLAAIGDEAALRVFDRFTPEAIYARNAELGARLRAALEDIGWEPSDLPEANRSTIVSVPLGDVDRVRLLAMLRERGVVAAAREGYLRLALHFYNHEDDIERLTDALGAMAERPHPAGAMV